MSDSNFAIQLKHAVGQIAAEKDQLIWLLNKLQYLPSYNYQVKFQKPITKNIMKEPIFNIKKTNCKINESTINDFS